MKRLTTYYFLLLGGLNVFLVKLLPSAATLYEVVIGNKVLEGQELPWWTEQVLQYSWWPWVGVVICVVGIVLSLLGKLKDNVLKNLLVILLFVELWVMFLSVVAFHLPLVGSWSVMRGGNYPEEEQQVHQDNVIDLRKERK